MSETSSQTHILEKVLSRRDLVLFSISAILLLDTVAAGAAVGVSSLFWWAFLGVVFFIPFSMISAELGCAFPDQGGIYAWVDRAYGKVWAARITWSYWVNIAVWLPAIFILFSGMFAQVFMPDLSLFGQIMVGIALTWITVIVNSVSLDIGKWVPNIGAIIKVVVFLAVIVGAYFYYQENGMANEISIDALIPNFSEGIKYIPVIIYGMLGFELVSASSGEMKNPKRDVPQSIYISGAIIFGLYFLATLAVLIAIPSKNINLVEGLVDTLRLFFNGSELGNYFVLILAIGTLYTFFSNGVTWALGGNRAMCEAAIAKEMPSFFGITHKTKGTPIGAAISLGIASTVILILYGMMAGNNEDLFWDLFAFSGVIFMIPYVAMALAFIKLRETHADTPRPYKVMGGDRVAKILAIICSLILLGAITLFIYDPVEGLQLTVFIGTVVLLIVGEICIKVASSK